MPGATGFYRLGGGYTLAKQTVFRMGWNDEALYLGVECEEPDAALMKPRARGRELENAWAQVRQVGSRARDARTKQLRQTLLGAQSLLDESYSHCYSFLIDELIRTP